MKGHDGNNDAMGFCESNKQNDYNKGGGDGLCGHKCTMHFCED